MPMDPVLAQQAQNAGAVPPKMRAKMQARMGKPGHSQSAGLQDFLSPFHLGIWGAPGYQGEEISGISRAMPMGRTRDLTNTIMPMAPPTSPTSAAAADIFNKKPPQSNLQQAAEAQGNLGYGGGVV